MKKIVGRPQKENKSNVITIRLTPAEQEELNHLKDQMQFDTVRDFFLFGMEVLKSLHGWHSSNQRFYIGKPGQKESYQEVEFEFTPVVKPLNQ